MYVPVQVQSFQTSRPSIILVKGNKRASQRWQIHLFSPINGGLLLYYFQIQNLIKRFEYIIFLKKKRLKFNTSFISMVFILKFLVL